MDAQGSPYLLEPRQVSELGLESLVRPACERTGTRPPTPYYAFPDLKFGRFDVSIVVGPLAIADGLIAGDF
jgi:hypothetical protein